MILSIVNPDPLEDFEEDVIIGALDKPPLCEMYSFSFEELRLAENRGVIVLSIPGEGIPN